jgi:hypothetical protein
MKLLLPLLGISFLLSASCRKKIEEITITKRDTVKILVDSSNYKRVYFVGNMHYTKSTLQPEIDSNYIATIIVTYNFKDRTVQFWGDDPFRAIYPINNSNEYAPMFRLGYDSLYAHFYSDNSHGTHQPTLIETYDFNGKK